MKTCLSLISAALACCAAAEGVAISDATKTNDWENPFVNSINRLPPRTYSMPLKDVQSAFTDELEPATPYRKSLNGTWKLSWAGRPQDRVLGFERPDFDDSDWFTITVPSCVELSGFGAPGYVNWMYPHTVDWPRILDRDTKKPDYNPVSSYRTTFTVPDEWKGRQVILRFDGVYSAYYVWVNGRQVGYAEDSKLPSEFDITSYLNNSNPQTLKPSNTTNLLCVEVYRWCDGSFFEDQDMTRFSGIFRDVTLWAKPKDGIWDFTVRTTPVGGYERWKLEVEVEAEGKVEASLYDANRKKIGDLSPLSTSSSNLTSTLTLNLDHPQLWSAEKPNLYTLVLKKGDDIRMKRIGFKDQKVVGNRFLVNGQPVKLRGVNRHETSPEGGRTLTRAEMVRDVSLMKRFNVNCVRTSHYPDHHLWYDLCDTYGLYVIAEANVESHELYQYQRTQAKDPTCDHTIVERNERQVGFYRNHPSVTIWSMGNETGHGDCFRHAIAAVKRLDPSRPVHWECGNRDADIDSRMYPDVEWLEKRGQYGDGTLDEQPLDFHNERDDHTKGKAFIMCEYAHAMGNAVGNLQEYWDVVYAHDSIIGGCIWDWIDQALWKKSDRGVQPDGRATRYLSYGGDNDEFPNDGPFNCNGVIDAERHVTPKLVEVGHVYRGLAVERRADGGYVLWNRFSFTDASEFTMRWELVEDGVVTRTGKTDAPAVAPLARGPLALPDVTPKPGAEAFLNLSFIPKTRPFWAAGTWIAAREQLCLAARPQPATTAHLAAKSIAVASSDAALTLSFGGTKAVFSRSSGTLARLDMGGKTVLQDRAEDLPAGPRLTYMRALVDNDKWLRPNYVFDGYDAATNNLWASGLSQPAYHVRPFALAADGSLRIVTEVTGRKTAAFTHVAIWRFAADGSLSVENRVTPHGILPRALPRLGLSLELPHALQRVRYYGRGPMENYIDRRTGSFVGVYETTPAAMYTRYVRPQDNGYRCDVRWVEFTDGADGRGVRFSASEPLFLQALPYTWEDLEFARHEKGQPRRVAELPVREETHVNLDVRQLGLGGRSCGPTPLKEYVFDPRKPVSWTMTVSPVKGGAR